MRGWLLGLCVLATAAAAYGAGAMEGAGAATQEDAAMSGWFENTFLEANAGMTMPSEQDSTWQSNLSINRGCRLTPRWPVGVQLGGRVTLRDDEPEWLGGAGLFQRSIPVGGTNMMWGLQGFWLNTTMKSDLAYIKPTLGLELTDRDYLALTGTWGKNESTVGLKPPWLTKQEGADQAALVWGTSWTDQVRTEMMAGYQFKGIDATMLGASVGWQWDPRISFNVGGWANFDGNYSATAGIAYDLGENSRNSTFINVHQDGEDDYTPLPLDNMMPITYETVRLWR